MAVKYIRCIKIVHPLSEVRLYRMLSSYFRFIGIFACENIAGKEYGNETDWKYEVKSGMEESEESLLQGFFGALDEMSKVFEEGQNEVKTVFTKIAEIFIQYDLMRGSYAISYFGDTGETYIYNQMIKARERFWNALEQLKKLEQERGERAPWNLYVWTAKTSCRRRFNELHTIVWNAIERGEYGVGEEKERRKQELWNLSYFRGKELEEDVRKVLEEAPEFYGIYAIYGFALELDDANKMDSVTKLKNAIDLIGEKPYTSYLYYRIGRYCEVIRQDLKEKMDYYRLAYEADSENYRAIYKLAVHEQRQNKKESLKLWGALLKILECKKELPSLQPIECAYLYKTYRSLGNLYIEMGNCGEGIECLEKAVEVYENKKNEKSSTGFYPWMFCEDSVGKSGKKSWEIYKEAAKKKLCIDDTYVNIIRTAALKNRKDIYKKYSEKRRKLQRV